jgi:hypothetical protein
MIDEPSLETKAAPPQSPPDANAVLGRMLARVLAGRALRATGAVLVALLAGWAMWEPTPLRAAIAAGFAGFTLLSQLIGLWAER